MTTKHSYLYVEDDALSREVMQTLLVEVVGVENLTILNDSRDFMLRLRAISPRPDFILLDIHVQPYDGYQLLRLIRDDADFRDCRVLAVTAGVMSDEMAHLKAEGFDGALAKPLDMLTFPDLIRSLEAGAAMWQAG
jgi:CheY-like chemotaxis protein